MHGDLLVIGLGYVGLPLAREATAAGMRVVGYDVNQAIVDRLNRGGSHVDDIPADIWTVEEHFQAIRQCYRVLRQS